MPNVCTTCGLPKEACTCDKIGEEKIHVSSQNRSYNKVVTVIKGIEKGKHNIEEIASYLKKNLACGGTVKNDQIELQGKHKSSVKNILTNRGFSPDSIKVK
ncbi:translation initiation factor Sui1 [candidate division MSBL1 archaeon SCGC-AAA382A20]|uniref:Protein translation factor SUI1 homolog n=1 Tax=candidate division MSBL1 archaeon SCGC-AAA382A20 TaxID=1698280 RepID=A0A133VK01_9EURY|nr:translation initiation factor Sui1 [candidate division MSBL1 archaeon SCGC-AAA382A20]